jgi:hypothetical protein
MSKQTEADERTTGVELGQSVDNFGTPRGTMSKRERRSIPKTDECGTVLELGHEGKFPAKSCSWG